MKWRFALVLAILATASAGCAPSTPDPKDLPTRAHSSSAMTEIDAVRAYKAYLLTYFAVLADGGESPDRLAAVASGSALETAQGSAEEVRSKHLHVVGALTLKSSRFQSASGDRASIYVCDDESKLDLVNAEGQSVASTHRSLYFPYIASLERGDDDKIRLTSLKSWTQGGVC